MSFDFKKDPLDNFLELFKEAQMKGIPDANAMALSTVNSENKPSVRIVLFKGMIRGGFSFFTNYDGRKAHDIENNKNIAATFFWSHLDRQIRIEGTVEKITHAESEAYFATRPRLSQLGAWSSHQSEKIESFEVLKNKINEIDLKFKGQNVPCPPHWGGFRIEASEIEFWFGRSGRLHERYVYQKNGTTWNRFLRSP
ncbi:MAG: pyridoxamine 5'-phosphate oxidase [Bdellovibrio sp.]|nr:pyridoxamine 5'-phosphate oxidase [Bdellovibrio sp.]